VRIFEDEQKWGDPYRYSFPFRFVSTGLVELYGVTGRAPTINEARAMLIAFRDAGIGVLKERKSGAMVGRRVITRKSYKPKRQI
jgi:hypothetical protein